MYYYFASTALLFMYGITGSGKTHTMQGTATDGGVLPRCLDVIFNSLGDLQARKYVSTENVVKTLRCQCCWQESSGMFKALHQCTSILKVRCNCTSRKSWKFQDCMFHAHPLFWNQSLPMGIRSFHHYTEMLAIFRIFQEILHRWFYAKYRQNNHFTFRILTLTIQALDQ